MSRTYYSLLYRPNSFCRWAIEFGDYSHQTVKQEMRDQKDSDTTKGQWTIIKSGAKQAEINAKVAELNAMEVPQAKRIHRPTSAEKATIRLCAQRASGVKRIRLEPGTRILLGDTVHNVQMNIRLLTEHPDWDDTDLFEPVPWKNFCRGFEMTKDGRAVVDFYIYSTGFEGELECNVVAYWEEGRLAMVRGTREEILFKAN